ncbi:RNA-directed DNA polymerase-like protein [Gossypium australe]|uniref:RNA-directed DNA polymerase-like protein n=1 Tax=Gossypium australe TaxID=47621 RepID=A0A5B6WH27_9ROSI|nr:RNA-directed DNA polymerase-like protein [Gossypium australe]
MYPKQHFACIMAIMKFLVMPFGLTNALAAFVGLMNCIFQLYLDQLVVAFIDDILIYLKLQVEYKQHLRIILQVLLLEVVLPRHVIFANGVHVDSKKIEAILQWKTPRNVSEVHSLLDLSSYYQRFVNGFSKIAMLMTKLLQKNVQFV